MIIKKQSLQRQGIISILNSSSSKNITSHYKTAYSKIRSSVLKLPSIYDLPFIIWWRIIISRKCSELWYNNHSYWFCKMLFLFQWQSAVMYFAGSLIIIVKEWKETYYRKSNVIPLYTRNIVLLCTCSVVDYHDKPLFIATTVLQQKPKQFNHAMSMKVSIIKWIHL